MLRAVISELEMQFTQAPQRKRKRDEEEAQSDVIRETFSQPRTGRRRPLNSC